ncbi:MAG: hypothetical protein KIT22_15270, partial [Verrucomicrobiae bacterium]|nr:hypothetical protein [Verrucomicrobiae bacterium]
MKRLFLAGVLLLVLPGCRRDAGGHGSEHDHAADAHEQGHEHGEAAPEVGAATFQEGQGILMKEESRKLLGLEVEEVSERRL